ncbi:pentahemic C cytochrome [Glaesserella sp.]|uniref:pentahemic C cytochrome n=1 Tax=Glaesserella sp. TaxID=2094731 RepID=UPI00359FB6FA
MFKPLFGVFISLCALPTVFAHTAIQFTSERTDLFLDQQLTDNIGYLEAGVPVKLIQTGDHADRIEITAWRKNKGFKRIWYNQFAKQITDVVLTKTFMQSHPDIEVLGSKEDPLTGLEWQQVKLQTWIKKAPLVSELNDFWAETESTYKTECSVCHKQRDTKMHDANEWIAVFNGMVGFTDMDEETGKKVLRYLQLHASDASQDK